MFAKTFIAAVAALAALAPVAGAQAQAADLGQTAWTRITVADLDLATDAGARSALRRIEAAAQLVCGPQPSPREFQSYLDWKGCVKTGVANAVVQLNNPKVAGLNHTVLSAAFAQAGR